MPRGIQTKGLKERSGSHQEQCQVCKLWFRVVARHYNYCSLIHDESERIMLKWGDRAKKRQDSKQSTQQAKRMKPKVGELANPPLSPSRVLPVTNQVNYVVNDDFNTFTEDIIGNRENQSYPRERKFTGSTDFMSSKLIRALCDAIPDLNEKKANNLLTALEKELPGKCPFKDKKSFDALISSISKRNHSTGKIDSGNESFP